MAKFFLMSGPSGSGKTTFAKKFAEKNGLLYLCPDDFYGLFHGDPRIHIDEFDIWMSLWRAIHLAEKKGRDCIVDTNSPTTVSRTQFLDWFDGFDEHHMIFLTASRELCIKNNSERSRVIPADEMQKILDSIQLPSIEDDERWSSITVMTNVNNTGFVHMTLRGENKFEFD